MEIKKYIQYRNTLKENFLEKYKGLEINGKDYREYVFNFFEKELNAICLVAAPLP